jgi:hypothetical protein
MLDGAGRARAGLSDARWRSRVYGAVCFAAGGALDLG